MSLSAIEKDCLHMMISTGTLLGVEDLHTLFEDALSRWEQFQGHRPSTWAPVLGGIKIAAEFEVPAEAALILDACPPERRQQVAIAYLAWNRHASTREHANPYEPLLSFFHHGGTWSRPENGILDIYDELGGKCGILTKSTL
ncbi:hypothetical protein [Undibacterium sp. Di24W]|uniref:hypothetical protein n=1 Tax=Undibacterium sp. Di24W TaxID=3413033 RepID=UPI003BF29C79